MITATVIGEVAEDARVSDVRGVSVANFRVRSEPNGRTPGITVHCSLWGSRAHSDILRGCLICATGTLVIHTGRDGRPPTTDLRVSDFRVLLDPEDESDEPRDAPEPDETDATGAQQ